MQPPNLLKQVNIVYFLKHYILLGKKFFYDIIGMTDMYKLNMIKQWYNYIFKLISISNTMYYHYMISSNCTLWYVLSLEYI